MIVRQFDHRRVLALRIKHRSGSINLVFNLRGARGYGDFTFTVHDILVIGHHTLGIPKKKEVNQSAEESLDLVFSAECVCMIHADPILFAVILPF